MIKQENLKEKPLLLQVASSGWTKLRSVNFGRYFVDDEILRSLGMHCPSLHAVVADRCGGAVTDEGIVSLARGCRRLFQVDLSRAHIGDAGMHAFAEFCAELRWLELNDLVDVKWGNVNRLVGKTTMLADLNNDGKLDAKDLEIAKAKAVGFFGNALPSAGGLSAGIMLGLKL